MSRAALSMMVFGGYMAVEGVALMIAPAFLAKLFMLPEPADFWVRVVGLALCVFGLYYVLAARAELTPFFRFSLVGRTLQLALFLALIAAGLAPLPLLLASGTEFASAVWTYLALRADARSPRAAVAVAR